MNNKYINDFRKGQKRNKYIQDPTYLTFFFQFVYDDGNMSPLLADALSDNPAVGTAAYYLKNYIKDEGRANSLKEFAKTLRLINSQMPWFWQTLTGAENFLNYNVNEPYRGGDEAKLTIGCLESLNLMVSGMMDLYRDAMWDEERWCWVVPDNLRKFTMIVYVSEIRKIQTTSANGSISSFLQTAFGVNKKNDAVTGDNLPFFAFRVGLAEFALTSGKDIFAELSASKAESPLPNIEISYERIHTYDAKYLNGIMDKQIGLEDKKAGNGFPGPLGDIVDQATDAISGIGDDLSGFVDSAVARGANQVQNMVNGLTANVFMGNVYSDTRTFRDALRQGSINSIANVVGDITQTPAKPKNNLGNAYGI
jgi:hypothetical protein